MKKKHLSLVPVMTLFINLLSFLLGSTLHAATVSGTVYDCNDNPISGSGGSGSGAYVYVTPHAGEPCGFFPEAGTPVWVQSDGTYALTLPAGTYYLRAWNYSYGSPHNDYVTEWRTESSSSPDCNDAHPITVSILSDVSGVDFQLDCGAIQIEGTVRDSGGTPVASSGISVTAILNDPCNTAKVFSYYPINLSVLPAGYYYLSGLPPATAYFLLASNYSGLTHVNEWWASAGSTVNCNEAEAVTGSRTSTDFYLDSGAITVSGTVNDSGGTPITGDSVNVVARLGEPCLFSPGLISTWTNPADGTYLIAGLPGDLTYYVSTIDSWQDTHVDEWWADPESAIECCDAETVTGTSTGIDFQLDSGAASISGTVRDSGGTAITGESLLVAAYRGKPCVGVLRGSGKWTNPSDGSYEITGLTPGTYYLRHFNWLGYDFLNEWWDSADGSQDCNDAEPLTISAGSAEVDKDFFLDGGSMAISGAVKDSGDFPATGRPIGVFAWETQCGGDGYQPVKWLGWTNYFDGTYMVSGFPSGSYYLSAFDAGAEAEYVAEWYASSGSVTDCSLGEAITGDSSNVDFSLDSAAGTISGTVKDHLGNPILDDHILVRAFSCDPDACGDQSLVGARFSGLLECDGTYEIPVASGTYYLNAFDIEGYYASEWWASSGSSPICSDAEPVTVLPSQTDKDFELGPQLFPVPSVSQWGMIALSLSVLGSASWVMRRRLSERKRGRW
jgi:hypothetical protein